MTTVLSETLVQVMFATGLPSAVQLSVILFPSITVSLCEMSLISGGPTKSLQQSNCRLNPRVRELYK